MPNKTIYLNKIREIEESVGFSFINVKEVAQKQRDGKCNQPPGDRAFGQQGSVILLTHGIHILSAA